MRSSRGSALSRMGSAPMSVSSAGPPSPEGLRAVTCWPWRVTSWVSSRWLGSSETGSSVVQVDRDGAQQRRLHHAVCDLDVDVRGLGGGHRVEQFAQLL